MLNLMTYHDETQGNIGGLMVASDHCCEYHLTISVFLCGNQTVENTLGVFLCVCVCFQNDSIHSYFSPQKVGVKSEQVFG